MKQNFSHQLRRQEVLLFEFCFRVRTYELSCFTYSIPGGMVSYDSIVDGDWLRANDVTRYEVRYDSELATELQTSRKIWGWVGCLYAAYKPGKRL